MVGLEDTGIRSLQKQLEDYRLSMMGEAQRLAYMSGKRDLISQREQDFE